jgi:hypothetical protein
MTKRVRGAGVIGGEANEIKGGVRRWIREKKSLDLMKHKSWTRFAARWYRYLTHDGVIVQIRVWIGT